MHRGIEFLLNVNLGYKFTIGKKVLVIGGGNVAMDVARSAAREVLRQHDAPGEITPSEENVQAVAAHEMMDISLSALRMGAREVGLVCLENRDEMPAALEEIEEAETEGIIMHPGFGPKRVLGRDGKVVGLECLKTKYVFDENHRFNPAFYENSDTQFECDTIILSIGQAPNLDFLRPEDGVLISPRGLINVNRDTLMTSAPESSPAATAPSVRASSSTASATASARQWASTNTFAARKHPEPQIEVEVLDRWQMAADYMNIQRQAIPMLPLERRTGMTEVELVYTEQEAMAEAQRCLKCYVNTILEGSEQDGTDCVLCGGCVDVCPENCLELVPLDRIEFEPNAIDALRNNPELFGFELEGIQPAELGSITGTAMIKDETRCIRCGLCALRCPGEHHHHGGLSPGAVRTHGTHHDSEL